VDTSLWLLMLACAVGTFMLRAVPLIWMRRHLLRQSKANLTEAMPLWLTVLAPTMIAAMLGVSLLPAQPGVGSLLATVAGGLCTLLIWRQTRSLGWPVCGGVALYAGVLLLSLQYQF
jgi:branched-subunit amino acid transport protein